MATTSGYAGFGSQFSRESVEVTGIPVYFLKGVRGEPLLYLHGLGGWGAWERHIFGLAMSYCPYVPQLPGWRDGRVPERVSSVKDYAEIMLEFLDAVGISKCVVAGHSIGGWIAQYLAADHPDRVSKLVLVDSMGVDVPEAPAADLANIDKQTFYEAVFTKMETIRVAGDFGDAPESVRDTDEFENEWKGREVLTNLSAGKASDPELTKRLGNITAPTLIVWGRDDELVPLRHGEVLAESIPGSKFIVIESDERQTAGHSPMRYRVETFNLVVRNFLVGDQEAPPAGLATIVKA